MGKPSTQSDRPQDLKLIIEAEVKRQLSLIRALILAFSAGLGLFVVVGLSFKEIFLLPLMKYVYPPNVIYGDVRENIAADQSLFRGEVLRTEVKSAAWEAMLSGDLEKFSALTSQAGFYSSLESKFDNELTNAFGIPGSVFAGQLNENENLRMQILKMGGEAQRADIRMVAKNMNRDTTSCGRTFRQDRLHAIIRIPGNADREKYGWLRCGGTAAPMYKISITANEKKLEEITLIGIERNGDTDSLELKVSLEVAKQLELPDWDSYKARVIGSYQLTDVYWE